MNRLTATPKEQCAQAACLRRGFGRQVKLDKAIWSNLKELGYGG